MLRWFVAVVIVLTLLSVLWLGMQLGERQGAHQTSVSLDGTPDTASVPEVAPTPPASRVTTSDAGDSLPAVGTPLSQVFDDLVARAARGDSRAACRLAFEIETCQTQLPQLQFSERIAQGLADVDASGLEGDDLLRLDLHMASVGRRLDARDALRAHCADVPQVSRARHVGWWRQAAMAGNLHAARGYVSGEALPLDQWMRNLGLVEQLRQDIEPLAWRQMHAGDLDMAWQLMVAHAQNPTPLQPGILSQAVEPDRVQALALALYMREALPRATGPTNELSSYLGFVDSWVTQLSATTDAEQLRRAEAQSREWNREIQPMGIPPLPSRRSMVDIDRNTERLESCAEAWAPDVPSARLGHTTQ